MSLLPKRVPNFGSSRDWVLTAPGTAPLRWFSNVIVQLLQFLDPSGKGGYAQTSWTSGFVSSWCGFLGEGLHRQLLWFPRESQEDHPPPPNRTLHPSQIMSSKTRIGGLSRDWGSCLCVFSPWGMTPKTHKQMFANHPVPGQSPKFAYVYETWCFFFAWDKGTKSCKSERLSAEESRILKDFLCKVGTEELLKFLVISSPIWKHANVGMHTCRAGLNKR